VRRSDCELECEAPANGFELDEEPQDQRRYGRDTKKAAKVAKAAKPKPRRPEVPWGESKAKRQLHRDIAAGKIPETMEPRFVVDTNPKLCGPYASWSSGYLSTARDIIKRQQRFADSDAAAFANNSSINAAAAATTTLRGCPRWQGSAAERLLKEDIDAGLHNTMPPGDLWFSRPEYHEQFPRDVFIKHIHQEKRSRIEGAYWRQHHKDKKNKKK